MAGKINATVLAVILVVIAMMTTSSVIMNAEARLDLSSIVGYMGINESELTSSLEVPESTTKKEACCDICICTRSLIPKCRCTDIKLYCHSKCKRCMCTKSISVPPQCRCMDIDNFCYPSGSSSSSSSSSNDAAAAFINGIAN